MLFGKPLCPMHSRIDLRMNFRIRYGWIIWTDMFTWVDKAVAKEELIVRPILENTLVGRFVF